MSLPELPDHQMWVVSMDGDTVKVALHITFFDGSQGKLLRFGTFESWEYSHAGSEFAFVKRVEDEAVLVLDSHKRRVMRQRWLQENFS